MGKLHLVTILLLLFLTACQQGQSPLLKVAVGGESHPSNIKALLALMADTATFPYNLSLDEEGAAFFEAQLQIPGNENDFNCNASYAEQLLTVGKSGEAANHYLMILEKIEKGEIAAGKEETAAIQKMLAIAYFRMSEQVNCIHNHNESSCIIPFNAASYHADSTGAVRSITVLEKFLRESPDDFEAKWLLNVAAAALGRKPESIRELWRIDLEKFKSPIGIKSFRDVANASNLIITRHAGGTAIDDFNNDGLLDVVVTSCKLKDNIAIFQNNGDGTFSDHTEASGLTGITGGINCTHVDFNNDGFEDLYVIRGGWFEGYGNYPESLLKNNGNGTFTDITYKAGLFSLHPTHSACWGDFNNDGWMDVFVGNETSDSSQPHPSELYINNGDETFTEVSAQSGIRVSAFVKGALWFDYNNDGWQDLYLSNYLQPNILFKNKGKDESGMITFTDVTKQADVELPLASFPAFACDINNDGWEDLFVSAFGWDNNGINLFDEYKGRPSSFPPALYINQKNGTFKDMAQDYGLSRTIFSMGLNYGDIDNDGWLDFYAGTGNPDFKSLFPNLMFRNAGGRYFEDVTVNTRTGHLQKGHGIAFADLDNDGDQDIYINIGGFYQSDFFWNACFENPGSGNHYIALKLVGEKSNRSAAGARIKITVLTEAGTKEIYRTVSTGGTFGASPFMQVIGVGASTKIQSIEIRWPSTGIRQKIENAEAGKAYLIKETAVSIEPLKTNRFSFQQ